MRKRDEPGSGRLTIESISDAINLLWDWLGDEPEHPADEDEDAGEDDEDDDDGGWLDVDGEEVE